MPGFSENLKAFRLSLPEGNSLDQFYEPLGVSGATGSRYESGQTEPTVSFLLELWEKYQGKVSHLMPGNVVKPVAGKIDGEVLEEAARLVDSKVVQGRKVAPTVRWELVSLVAAEIVDLRALGRAAEIEDRMKRWLAAAKAGLGA